MLVAVIVDVVRYEDFQTNQYLKEVASGQTHTPAKSTLWQVHLDPKFGKVTAIQSVLDRHSGCATPTGASPLQLIYWYTGKEWILTKKCLARSPGLTVKPTPSH